MRPTRLVDGRIVAARATDEPVTAWLQAATAAAEDAVWTWNVVHDPARLIDVPTGRPLGRVGFAPLISPDGATLAEPCGFDRLDEEWQQVQVWDVPHRRSRGWLLVGAAAWTAAVAAGTGIVGRIRKSWRDRQKWYCTAAGVRVTYPTSY